MRLNQNLQDAQDLVSALRQDIENLWYVHSSVLQTKPKKMNRPMRVNAKTYRERLYRLGQYSDDVMPAGAAGDDDADADDECDKPDEAN